MTESKETPLNWDVVTQLEMLRKQVVDRQQIELHSQMVKLHSKNKEEKLQNLELMEFWYEYDICFDAEEDEFIAIRFPPNKSIIEHLKYWVEDNLYWPNHGLGGHLIDVIFSFITTNILSKAAVTLWRFQSKQGMRLRLNDKSIGDQRARVLGHLLAKNTSMVLLSLSSNQIGDPGATWLAEGLAANTTDLKLLNISNNQIGDEGARQLGIVLAKNTTLKNLNLCRNEIGAEGARGLSEGLAKNKTLEELNLWKNHIGDDGARSVGKGLMKNRSLRVLNLCNNQIGVEGARGLAQGLAKNRRLQELSLSYNYFGTEGAAELLNKKLATLWDLHLHNSISRFSTKKRDE